MNFKKEMEERLVIDLLWLDDEYEVVEPGIFWLIKHGFDVKYVKSWLEAEDALKNKRYPLLITDYSMPKVTGKSVCRMVKKSYPEIKIIMCSGTVRIFDRELQDVVGIDDFIEKPYSFSDLIVRIRNLIK